MDSNNGEWRILRITAAHLRDRASKHENKPEAKKDSANDLCFHVIYFPFIVLAFRPFLGRRSLGEVGRRGKLASPRNVATAEQPRMTRISRIRADRANRRKRRQRKDLGSNRSRSYGVRLNGKLAAQR